MGPATAIIGGSVVSGVFNAIGSIFGHRKRKRARREALRQATEANVKAAQNLAKVAERQSSRRQASADISPTGINQSSAGSFEQPAPSLANVGGNVFNAIRQIAKAQRAQSYVDRLTNRARTGQ